MSIVVTIFICVALILCGAVISKPPGWVVVVLAVLALLFAVLGGVPLLGHR